MTGSEHSKKSKTVTIDLEPEAVQEIGMDSAADDAEERGQSKVYSPTPPTAEAETVVPAVVKQSSGLLGRLGTGVVGGLIALIGGAALQYAGKLPSFGQDTQLSALKAEIVKLSSIPAIDPTVIDGLSREQGALSAQLSSLSSDITKLKSAVPGFSNDAVAALEGKLAALETAVANMPVGAVPTDAVSSALFKTLSDKVAALEAKPIDTGGAKSVATAIAASGLKAAIDRGGSFMSELETYASVVPASPDVEALRDLAAKGVPSQQELLAGFGDAASAMIAAAIVPNPDMGILQRLTESAKGLVKARRVGDIEGDEADAVLARMEVALQRGNLGAVLTQSDKLPAASKVAGKEFLDRLTARRDTDTLVTRALGAALVQAGGKS